MKKSITAVATILLLTGCSNSEPKSLKENGPKAEHVSSTVDKINEEEQAYRKYLIYYLDTFSASLNDFGRLSIESSKNIKLFNDRYWQDDMNSCLYAMEEMIDEIVALEPPNKFKKVHATTYKAMMHFQYAIDKYQDSINSLSPELIRNYSDSLTKGSDDLEEALILLEQIK